MHRWFPIIRYTKGVTFSVRNSVDKVKGLDLGRILSVKYFLEFLPRSGPSFKQYIDKGKRLDLGAEPPRVKRSWVPPPPSPSGPSFSQYINFAAFSDGGPDITTPRLTCYCCRDSLFSLSQNGQKYVMLFKTFNLRCMDFSLWFSFDMDIYQSFDLSFWVNQTMKSPNFDNMLWILDQTFYLYYCTDYTHG